MTQKTKKTSTTRKIYFARLVFRCVVLLLAIGLYLRAPEVFSIAVGMGFFEKFSVLHLLWGAWIIDMIIQLMPVKAHISIGSQKQFRELFLPMRKRINVQNLKQYIRDTTNSAYKVMILWIALTAVLCVLYTQGVLDVGAMVLVSTFFYVCDLICVLIWCPFRLIMKNKCCTTCRIFNWDHLMMFSPLIAVRGFFGWTLVILAIVNWLVWEVCVFMYPERFWENSNMALRCSECTDKLCTQYCRKLRK